MQSIERAWISGLDCQELEIPFDTTICFLTILNPFDQLRKGVITMSSHFTQNLFLFSFAKSKFGARHVLEICVIQLFQRHIAHSLLKDWGFGTARLYKVELPRCKEEGLLRLLIFIAYTYLSGLCLGLDLRTNTKEIQCLEKMVDMLKICQPF